ncbi:MAG: hypothetical protein AAB263_10215, partial [Planctomycetota bacterium]
MWTLLGSTILSFIFSGGTGKAYIDWLRGKRAKNAVHLTMGFIWLDNAWLVVRFLFFTWPYRICRWLLGGGARNLFFSGEDLKSTVEAFRVRDHQRHTDDELVTECNIAADQWVQMIADKEGMEVLTKAYPSSDVQQYATRLFFEMHGNVTTRSGSTFFAAPFSFGDDAPDPVARFKLRIELSTLEAAQQRDAPVFACIYDHAAAAKSWVQFRIPKIFWTVVKLHGINTFLQFQQQQKQQQKPNPKSGDMASILAKRG